MTNNTLFSQNRYDVAIIGAGFSGTMVAVNLARQSPRELRIALIERGKSAGRGVAYGTTDPQHLLNVRADQMGAFADDIGHFWRWLERHPERLADAGVERAQPGSYVPRLVFGDYIQEILRDARAEHPGIEVISDDIVDVEACGAAGFELTSASGKALRAGQVVLALGNFPPAETTANPHAENPYSPEVWERLAAPGDVLIIGTGLTSLDLVMTLAQRKTDGVIHLLSRRGLFPQTHHCAAAPQAHVHAQAPLLDPEHLPTTARQLCHAVRAQVRAAQRDGGDWREVVDSLRPLNQRLWESLSEREQRRFLRFLRAFWDTHRHRCAPEIMQVRDGLQARGRLITHRGHIVSLDKDAADDKITVSWRPAGSGQVEQFQVRQVVSCTGPQSDIRKMSDALVKSLLGRDLVAPDRLRIGMATRSDYTVLNQEHRPVAGLYTLGSPLKGRLYESIAVPELRGQADEVARVLLSASAERLAA